MKLKELTNEELQTMAYDEIAYLIIEESGKKIKLLDLFKKVCKVLSLPESVIEERIVDFFELLSINKKFILLKNGYWDLATKHKQDIVVEDEEDVLEEEIINNIKSYLQSKITPDKYNRMLKNINILKEVVFDNTFFNINEDIESDNNTDSDPEINIEELVNGYNY